MANVLSLTFGWSEVLGWVVVAVAALVGLLGVKTILESGDDPAKDFMTEMSKGIGYLVFAVALGTAGLTLAGVVDPDWLKDPFNL